MNDNMNEYWKSEWMLLSIEYNKLKKENKNLKFRNTILHKNNCDLRLKYEKLILKQDLQDKKL